MTKTKIRTHKLMKVSIVFAAIAILITTFISTHPISAYASENDDFIFHYQTIKEEIETRTDDIKNDSQKQNKAYYSVQNIENYSSSIHPDSTAESVSTNSSASSNSISGYDQHLAEFEAVKEKIEDKNEKVEEQKETTDTTETTTENSNGNVDVAAMQEAILQDYLNQSKEMQDDREQFEKDEESVYQRINDINEFVHPISNALLHPSAKTIIAFILLFLLTTVGGVVLRALITRAILSKKKKPKEEKNDSADNSDNHQTSSNNTDDKANTASDEIIDDVMISEAAHGCEF